MPRTKSNVFIKSIVLIPIIELTSSVFTGFGGALALSPESNTSSPSYSSKYISSATIISPAQAVQEMKIGINLGNTLDAYPNEGDWAPKAEQYYFSAFKTAGFKHVRMPVTWDHHADTTPPYKISKSRMNRVEKLVDWALAEGLYVIINAHHETWLKKNYANADYRARFDAIWKQIAFRFKNKSPKLLFEILNEPTGMTKQDVDDLNPRILGVIREHNPTRLVVYSGNNYTSLHNLLTTKKLSDNYVIGNFHAYSPWEFAGLCKKSWGSKKDIHTLKWIYKRAHVWSTKHDIPVTINEFGVAKYNANRPENICSQKERISYLQTHVKFSKKYGIAVTVWDDGGIFSLYNRRKNTWTEDKDALVEANN